MKLKHSSTQPACRVHSFVRRRRVRATSTSPVHRRSSSVGYLHCRRNEFLPVNKRVDFTTVNQATRRFRPLRPRTFVPALDCSLFFFLLFLLLLFFTSLPSPRRRSFVFARQERLLYLLRYCISLLAKRLRDFHKIGTRCTPSSPHPRTCITSVAPLFIAPLPFFVPRFPCNARSICNFRAYLHGALIGALPSANVHTDFRG